MDTDTIYTLHLFAGAGGGILGDLLLGHIPVGAVEIEAYPRKVLLARQLDGIIPRFPIWDDVCTFRADNPDTSSYIERLRGIRDRLCICGGFPCQDISCQGNGTGIEGERSGLWKEFKRIIGETRPKHVFVENSPMLTVRGATRVTADLAEMGYVGRNCVLGAGHAGASHLRERMWILASDPYQVRLQRCQHAWRETTRKSVERMVACKIFPRSSHDIPTPYILGVRNGMANRMDRTCAIGNGQVPAVVSLAWETLS